MKQFLRDNWFKIVVIIMFFVLIATINSYISSWKTISKAECEEKLATSTGVGFSSWSYICDEIGN